MQRQIVFSRNIVMETIILFGTLLHQLAIETSAATSFGYFADHTRKANISKNKFCFFFQEH